MTFNIFFDFKRYFLFLFVLTATQFGCDSEDNENYFDCVGDLDTDEFYFLGDYEASSFEYYKNDSDEKTVVEESIRLQILSDGTFNFRTEFLCDTINDIENTCSIWGIWTFEQNIQPVDNCWYFWLQPEDNCTQDELRGKCYFTITNSTIKSQIGQTYTSDFYVGCSFQKNDEFSLIRWREFRFNAFLPLNDTGNIKVRFTRQERLQI